MAAAPRIPQKVARIRAELPDAAYAEWEGIGEAVRAAIAAPPTAPVVPSSDSGPRSGRPLAQKLGIKPGATIALVDAPEGIEAALAPLPEGASVRAGNRAAREITIWFVTARSQLEKRFAALARAVGEGTLWVAWPKGSSGVETDLSENAVRGRAPRRSGRHQGLRDRRDLVGPAPDPPPLLAPNPPGRPPS